jgi:hypothetical protein
MVAGGHPIMSFKVKIIFPINDFLITEYFGGWSSYIMGCLIFG